jgi:hypothetical protein
MKRRTLFKWLGAGGILSILPFLQRQPQKTPLEQNLEWKLYDDMMKRFE